jgi:hypothetical protein
VKYKLKVFGTGLLITAKKISAQKSKFWQKKGSHELLSYLHQGNDDFENFEVPKGAQMQGILAEEEIDLTLNWSHECKFSSYKFKQVYGPKLNKIDRIEFVDTANKNKIVWSINHPEFESLTIPDEIDESVTVYFEVDNHNLIILESEKGCWTYECNYEIKKPLKSTVNLKTVLTNCSFGEELDSIMDNVCVGFVLNDNLFVLSDAETDTLGNYATICDD